MIQQSIQSTNYLEPKIFYNDFLDWLVRLPPFHMKTGRPSMPPITFQMLFRLMYGCGLRVSEALQLTPEDFDLEHRIIRIQRAKTGRNQKTTILPYDIPRLEKFLKGKQLGKRLFPTSRSTVSRYAKNTGIMAGLNIFESQKERDVTGIFTHIFRKSCSKRMRILGADRELRMRKLRHAFKDAHDTYDAVDLNTLSLWEAENFTVEIEN